MVGTGLPTGPIDPTAVWSSVQAIRGWASGCRRGAGRLMDCDHLTAPCGEFANVVQQCWGGLGDLVEPGAHPVPQLRPAGGVAVVVEEFLAQLAPDLLDRVGPRGVGGQPQ